MLQLLARLVEADDRVLLGVADQVRPIGENLVAVGIPRVLHEGLILPVEREASNGVIMRHKAHAGMVEDDPFAVAGDFEEFCGRDSLGIRKFTGDEGHAQKNQRGHGDKPG